VKLALDDVAAAVALGGVVDEPHPLRRRARHRSRAVARSLSSGRARRARWSSVEALVGAIQGSDGTPPDVPFADPDLLLPPLSARGSP
jgi:hypothetical protein